MIHTLPSCSLRLSFILNIYCSLYSTNVIFSSGNSLTRCKKVSVLKNIISYLLTCLLTYLLTYYLTYLLHGAESFLRNNWFAASQEISRILRNPKAHYRTHKRPPPVSILGQPNPVRIPTSHLLEIHPNIIHPSTPRSPQWSPSLRFPHQDSIHAPLLTHTRHMSSPSHSSRTSSVRRNKMGKMKRGQNREQN